MRGRITVAAFHRQGAAGLFLAMSLIAIFSRAGDRPDERRTVRIGGGHRAVCQGRSRISSHDRIALDRGALAATMVGGRRALHVGFTGTAKDRPELRAPVCTKHRRRRATWAVSKRLNGEKKAANHVHVSAAGSDVYLAWLGVDTGGERDGGVRFRANRDNGAPSAWRPIVRLTTRS